MVNDCFMVGSIEPSFFLFVPAYNCNRTSDLFSGSIYASKKENLCEPPIKEMVRPYSLIAINAYRCKIMCIESFTVVFYCAIS